MMMKLFPNKKKKSDSNQDTQVISEPAEFDVLCGKDKTYGKHPGNQVFRARIESWVEPYQNAGNKQEKMRFTRQIVSSMATEYNARFIRRAPTGGWQEISDQMARDKVSHALRFAAGHKQKPKKNKKKKSFFSSSSSTSSEESLTKRRKVSASGITTISGMTSSTDTPHHPLRQEPQHYTEHSHHSPMHQAEVDSIYQRQQVILGTLRHIDPVNQSGGVPPPQSLSGNFLPHTQQQQPLMTTEPMDVEEEGDNFNTLRSVDLAEIMREPLFKEDEDALHRSAEFQFNKSAEFTSLRSEDLNMILSEPLGSREWEKVDSMR